MLLAYAKDRDLSWQPARWLLVAVLAVCLIHGFLPGFTSDRPRDMTLMYSEVEGDAAAYVALESIYKRHVGTYAKEHSFEMTELNSGRLDTVERPARETVPLGLPGISIEMQGVSQEEGGWRRQREISLPERSRLVLLAIPK